MDETTSTNDKGPSEQGRFYTRRNDMLRWALIFFIVALVAAFFGFGGIAAGAAGIGKILFFGFIVLAGIALVSGLARGRGI